MMMNTVHHQQYVVSETHARTQFPPAIAAISGIDDDDDAAIRRLQRGSASSASAVNYAHILVCITSCLLGDDDRPIDLSMQNKRQILLRFARIGIWKR